MADSVADLLKTYDASAAPLRASYAQQAAQGPTGIFANVDPVMLGLAQGFLSPTKTGGFGESIGTALAGAQGPLEAMRKRQLSAQEKMMELDLARAKLAMEAPYYQARAAHLGSGGTGDSLSSRSVTLNRTWAILNSVSDPADLEMTEEQLAEAKANVARQLIELSLKGGGKSGGGGGEEGGVAGGIPQITNDAKGRKAYDKIPPGGAYIDPNGNYRTKANAPGERG